MADIYEAEIIWAVAKENSHLGDFFESCVFALLNGSWFQLHACEILESYEIVLLSKFRGKVGYVQDFDQKRRSAAASGRS